MKYRRPSASVVERLILSTIAVALTIGTLGRAAHASIEDVDWVTFRADGPVVEHPTIDATRRSELASLDAGSVNALVRFDYSLEGGLLIERVRLARLFLTTDGIEQSAEIEIGAVPSRESISISTAYSIRPDGRRVTADEATVQLTDEVIPRIFSDYKKLTIPCPAIEVGSICAIDYERRIRIGDWPLPWSASAQLKSTTPIERIEIRARNLSPDIAWSSTDEDLVCDARPNGVVCSKSRVEALPPDVDLSLVLDQLPLFLIGERLSWRSVSERVGQLVENEVAKGLPDGAVDRILDASGVRRDADPSRIWEALFAFSADDVRYLGFEQGRNAVVPHPPATTLERRFGDCKDKVTLLIALARAAGLDAYPVLVATDRFAMDPVPLPSGGYFDHMVVCYRPESGAPHCADPTLSNARAESSALAVAGRLALRLDGIADAPELMSAPRFASRIDIDTTTNVSCDGTVESKIERAMDGEAKIRFRAEYANVAPAIRRRFLAQEFQQVTRSDQRPKIELAGLHDRNEPIRITARLSTPGGGSLGDEHLHIAYEPWLVHHGMSYRTSNLNYPVRVSGMEVVSRHTFSTCDESGIRYHGPILEMETEFGRVMREYHRIEDDLVVETRLEFPQRILEVEDFDRVDHFLDNALAQTMIWFELVRRR